MYSVSRRGLETTYLGLFAKLKKCIKVSAALKQANTNLSVPSGRISFLKLISIAMLCNFSKPKVKLVSQTN